MTEHRDPLPLAREALDARGDLPSSTVVLLAKALIEAHAKVDQLYRAIEGRSDATRTVVERVLSDTAGTAPSTAACRALRQALREALDRGVVFEENLDQQRLDWLSADAERLELVAVRLRVLVDLHGTASVREAIDDFRRPADPATAA